MKSYLNCSSARSRWHRATLWSLFFIRARPFSWKPIARIRAWYRHTTSDEFKRSDINASTSELLTVYTLMQRIHLSHLWDSEGWMTFIRILFKTWVDTVTGRWQESPSSQHQGSGVDFLSDLRSLKTGLWLDLHCHLMDTKEEIIYYWQLLLLKWFNIVFEHCID